MSLSLSWTGLVSVSMRWALAGPVALVEQDGLADTGELAEQGTHGQVQPETNTTTAADSSA